MIESGDVLKKSYNFSDISTRGVFLVRGAGRDGFKGEAHGRNPSRVSEKKANGLGNAADAIMKDQTNK